MSAIGPGRARPAYEPRALQCPSCGSPLTVRDERATFTTCPSCDSEIGLSAAEARVLGQRDRQGRAPAFDLEVGHPCTVDGHRYEVAARLAYRATDDDYDDPLTYQYLLYSPRRTSLWLSSWNDQWDLTRTSHVMPLGHPFAARAHTLLQTHDGQRWVVEEVGTNVLVWVDGALPWTAQQGDRHDYVECSRQRDLYEVTRSGDEIEFGTGRKLSIDEVVAITGLERLGQRLRSKAPVNPLFLAALLAVAILGFMVNATTLVTTMGAGERVFQERFTAPFLDKGNVAPGEVLTRPMRLGERTGLVRVEVGAPDLRNAWTSVNLALVQGQDTVIHVDDAELGYYSGRDADGNWTEDSSRASKVWRVPEPGDYRLLIKTRGAPGESVRADRVMSALDVEVIDGTRAWWWPAFGILLCAGAAVLAVLGLITSGSRS